MNTIKNAKKGAAERSTDNYVKAVECYRKSAEKGDVYAQCALAECYFEGKGIDVDIDKAACWYKKAAVQGFKDAETKLKQMGF